MKKEQYKSMKQLSRIEYLLLRRNLDDSYRIGQSLQYAFLYILLSLFICIIGLLMYIAFERIEIIGVALIFAALTKPIMIILALAELICLIVYIVRIKKFDRNFLEAHGNKH